MGRLCVIYNFAQLYREPIFTEIDRRWDCSWYFGKNTTDIKEMDISKLSDATEVPNERIGVGAWYRLKGLSGKLKGKNFSTYLALGEPYCLSIWWLAMKLRLFGGNKKLYFWTHGWYGKETYLRRIIKKSFFKLADGIFLYGNYARNLMIKEGFDPDKLFVIHNSLDYKKQKKIRRTLKESDIYRNHFGNNDPTLIFIGRLTAVKRLELLIKAQAILLQRGTPCNLVLVGDGEKREELEALVKEKNLSDRVWIYGRCYDDNINAELIYNASLCVAPGNVGLTAMHTMVFGTPVISHSEFKWQMPEFEAIRPGKTGDFFKHEYVDDLACTIERWLKEHTDRDAVRKACFAEIDNGWNPAYQMNVLEKHLIVK